MRARLTTFFSSARAYPPKTEKGMHELHQQICDSPSAVHHKLSVFYYLLLDYDSSQRQGSYAGNFAYHFAVPEKYKLFMKGLWLMDRGEFQVRSFPLEVDTRAAC